MPVNIYKNYVWLTRKRTADQHRADERPPRARSAGAPRVSSERPGLGPASRGPPTDMTVQSAVEESPVEGIAWQRQVCETLEQSQRYMWRQRPFYRPPCIVEG